MRRQVEYQWRVRELMARNGMRNSRELVGPLRERGITLSESQIYRLVARNPNGSPSSSWPPSATSSASKPTNSFTFTAADAGPNAKRAAASGENVVRFADAYKPVRARIGRER